MKLRSPSIPDMDMFAEALRAAVNHLVAGNLELAHGYANFVHYGTTLLTKHAPDLIAQERIEEEAYGLTIVSAVLLCARTGCIDTAIAYRKQLIDEADVADLDECGVTRAHELVATPPISWVTTVVALLTTLIGIKDPATRAARIVFYQNDLFARARERTLIFPVMTDETADGGVPGNSYAPD